MTDPLQIMLFGFGIGVGWALAGLTVGLLRSMGGGENQ